MFQTFNSRGEQIDSLIEALYRHAPEPTFLFEVVLSTYVQPKLRLMWSGSDFVHETKLLYHYQAQDHDQMVRYEFHMLRRELFKRGEMEAPPTLDLNAH